MNRMRHQEMSPWSRRDLEDMDSRAGQAMCAGKDPLTWAQAKAILSRPQRKGRTKTAYHCPLCHAWHIGNPLKKRKPWRRM